MWEALNEIHNIYYSKLVTQTTSRAHNEKDENLNNIFILSKEKIRAFNAVPKFSHEERDVMFMITKKVRRILNKMRTPENKVGFILQRGYFQVKGRFFNVDKFRALDKKHVERLLGLKKTTNLERYSSTTAANHKAIILRQYHWVALSNKKKNLLEQHALLHVDKKKSAENVLFAVFDYCWKSKIEIPSYNQFAEIISQSFIDYENTILSRLQDQITEKQKILLKELLSDKNDGSGITVTPLRKIN